MRFRALVPASLTASLLLAGCRKDAEPSPSTEKPQPTTHGSAGPGTAPPPGPDRAFEPTQLLDTKPPGETPAGMVWIPGGEFSMGSADPTKGGHCHEPMDDARPIHRVRLDGYWMDETEVTNEAFDAFTRATGYVTVAERVPTEVELPGVPAEARVAGSAVFTPTSSAVPLDQPLAWWRYVAGASWRQPEGPGSSWRGREKHPVVHIAYPDAVAYARWAKKDLPTEAEWEFAARGGLSGKLYPWGDELKPGGEFAANIHQGTFPVTDTGADGFRGSAPVKSFPPNAFGLYDMAGNAWEWVLDWYRADAYRSESLARGAVAENPRGPADSLDPSEPGTPKRVHRGGSFLCTSEYCTRYMVGTRGKAEPNSPASHMGFRCVQRPAH